MPPSRGSIGLLEGSLRHEALSRRHSSASCSTAPREQTTTARLARPRGDSNLKLDCPSSGRTGLQISGIRSSARKSEVTLISRLFVPLRLDVIRSIPTFAAGSTWCRLKGIRSLAAIWLVPKRTAKRKDCQTCAHRSFSRFGFSFLKPRARYAELDWIGHPAV
jgi:hypothetical protein